MSVQARQSYLEGEVLQASPIQLVQILYREALRSVRRARELMRQKEVAGRARQISRASEILNELALAVNHEKGGAIAKNLVELYDYMQRRLNEANSQQAERPLEELEGLLSVLLEAWEACAGPAEAPAGEMLTLAAEEYSSYSPRRLTY